jgi:hypothetical protein
MLQHRVQRVHGSHIPHRWTFRHLCLTDQYDHNFCIVGWNV